MAAKYKTEAEQQAIFDALLQHVAPNAMKADLTLLNAKNSTGHTALDVAIGQQNEHISRALLEVGAVSVWYVPNIINWRK